jgi:branched-chain amino acid transport system permease protein
MITSLVFFISGALGGVGAVLVSIAFNQVNSSLGSSYLVLALAVMVIGGFGSVAGTLTAGLGLGVISSFTTAYVTSSFRDVVIFGLLMLFLIVRPSGLFRVADSAGRP